MSGGWVGLPELWLPQATQQQNDTTSADLLTRNQQKSHERKEQVQHDPTKQ